MLLNWYLFSLRRTSGRLRFRQLLVVWYYRGTQAGPTKLSCQATFQAALLLDSREINCGVSSLSSISMRGFAELRLDYFAFFSFCFLSELIPCGRLHVTNTNTRTYTHSSKKIYIFGIPRKIFSSFRTLEIASMNYLAPIHPLELNSRGCIETSKREGLSYRAMRLVARGNIIVEASSLLIQEGYGAALATAPSPK
jgi:hypothetical protein